MEYQTSSKLWGGFYKFSMNFLALPPKKKKNDLRLAYRIVDAKNTHWPGRSA